MLVYIKRYIKILILKIFHTFGLHVISYQSFKFNSLKGIIDNYCIGKGIEIGPGKFPYCNSKNTIFIDKFNNDSVQIISEAENLPLHDSSFDYILSSHCLEHCPNTLKTLYEWKRVIKGDGILVLILPHGKRTFDNGRTLTNLKHHIEDYQNKVSYDDTNHWIEFINITMPQKKHPWISEIPKCNNGIPDFNWVVDKGLMHFHVWTLTEMLDVLRYLRFNIIIGLDYVLERTDSFLIVAHKNIA